MARSEALIPYSAGYSLSPPRAEVAVSPSTLDVYERMGWWAQVKKNGTYNIIYVAPDKTLRATTRRHEEHKLWGFSGGSAHVFRHVPGNKWWVFCAELLHSKGTGERDVNYVHDVLVADGMYLAGESYRSRYQILRDLWPEGARSIDGGHFVVDNHTWLARNIEHDFARVFANLGPKDEGLVLKDPNGRLTPRGTTGTVKCRLPRSNLQF